MKIRLTFIILLFFSTTLTLSAQDRFDFGVESYNAKMSTFQQKDNKKDEKVLKVYPIPATHRITFELKKKSYTKNYEIKIYNFLGKAIDKVSNFHDKKSINLRSFYSGIYIYQLRDKKGRLVESGKFNVVKQ